MSEIITVGLDLAKNVFQAHGADASGRALLRKKLRRDQVLAFFGQLPPCVVDDAIGAGAAGILRAAGDDDTEQGGHDVEPFRDIFPDAVQAAPQAQVRLSGSMTSSMRGRCFGSDPRLARPRRTEHGSQCARPRQNSG